MRLLWLVALGSTLASIGAGTTAQRFLRKPLIIDGILGLQYAENPGIAFGFFLGSSVQYVLIVVVFLLVISFTRYVRTPIQEWEFGLIIGGGLANILDRIAGGTVTDFLFLWPLPLFNIADACITIGAALLLFQEVMEKRGLRRGGGGC